jgi:hypothetical protein
MIYFKNLQTNDVITFENQNAIGSSFYDTTTFKELKNGELNAYLLQEAKNKKLEELEALFQDTLNTKIINIKYIGSGSTVINSEINLKIDDQTTSELGKVKDFFDLNPTIKTSAFGDAISKTTKTINRDTLTRYSLMSGAIINLEPNGLYPKRRAIKSQINALTSIVDVNNFNIVFE